jgi:hypothetical protein
MQPLMDKQQQQQVLAENGCQVVYNLQTGSNCQGYSPRVDFCVHGDQRFGQVSDYQHFKEVNS